MIMCLVGEIGVDVCFMLLFNVLVGGYLLCFDYNGGIYGGVFCVVEYIKLYFDVNFLLDKVSYGMGEVVKGKISLCYLDGKLVKNGKVLVSLCV